MKYSEADRRGVHISGKGRRGEPGDCDGDWGVVVEIAGVDR